MTYASCFNYLKQCRVIVLDFLKPFRVDFVPFPLVRENSGIAPFPVIYIEACSSAPVPFRIEWGVGSDEINRLTIHSTKDRQIVEFVKYVIGEVLGHFISDIVRG